MLSPRKRNLINAFIIFHIVAILLGTSQVFPNPPLIKDLFRPYLHWLRLSQSWVLFAPEPSKSTKRWRVEVSFENLRRQTWERPYPPLWDFFERHLAYNFQKIDMAVPYMENSEALRRDYSAYAMRQVWNEWNKPQEVTLIRSMADWPAPTEDGELQYDPKILQWSDYKMSRYFVKDGKLQ